MGHQDRNRQFGDAPPFSSANPTNQSKRASWGRFENRSGFTADLQVRQGAVPLKASKYPFSGYQPEQWYSSCVSLRWPLWRTWPAPAMQGVPIGRAFFPFSSLILSTMVGAIMRPPLRTAETIMATVQWGYSGVVVESAGDFSPIVRIVGNSESGWGQRTVQSRWVG